LRRKAVGGRGERLQEGEKKHCKRLEKKCCRRKRRKAAVGRKESQ
jgi:hypothetical protein